MPCTTESPRSGFAVVSTRSTCTFGSASSICNAKAESLPPLHWNVTRWAVIGPNPKSSPLTEETAIGP